MTTQVRILMLDAISHFPLGTAMTNALEEQGLSPHYIDAKKLPKKFAYKLRRIVAKKLQKRTPGELRHFYYPLLEGKHVEEAINKVKPDIILIIGHYHTLIDKAVLQRLKETLGFKLILFDTESANFTLIANQILYFIENELPLYDKVFSFSKPMAHYFKELGFNAEFFPYGAEPLSQLALAKTQDVFFVATPDMRRVMTLENLNEFPLQIYGKKWLRYKKLLGSELSKKIIYQDVWGDELNQLLQSSKIVLNINNIAWHSIESGVNLRIFETLAARSFLLTEYSQEIEELFIIGKELETFKCNAELKDKVHYYLTHDTERETIAQKGYEKYLAHYTWQKRCQLLIEKILQEFFR